jgi:hypothetical protein
MLNRTTRCVAAVFFVVCANASGAPASEQDLASVVAALQEQLAAQRARIEAQQRQLDQLQSALNLTQGAASTPGSVANAGADARTAGEADEPRAVAVAYDEDDEEARGQEKHAGTKERGRIDWSGYGVIDYFNYDWDTDPERRDAIDNERFVLKMETPLARNVELEAEIEFEHGGTGATMEFDPFEEFGEFETEIEKGGEVEIEELALEFEHSPGLNWRVGHFIVPVGTINPAHRPADYFTVTRSEAEAALIPQLWHETGVAQFGRIGDLRYEVQLVNGLDSTGFSSANWVAPGLQQRFEMVNAEDFAVDGRLDYEIVDDLVIGGSAYWGNTGNNRPKDDVDVDAPVTIYDVHGTLTRGPWTVRALWMAGHLDDSEAITLANRNLSNNLNVKRTPVASDAQAAFVEAGYDIAPLARRAIGKSWPAGRLDLYARYDDYDSMEDVEGSVFDNPRWDRQAWTAGWSWQPTRSYLFKGEYSLRELGTDTLNEERTVALGLGFIF